ncbi:resolvase [Niastella vici]|uniref:Resolvase n=2 Tax=Niastella vici TaxID=1703345 RepID=A0A1V9G327_9BACT|nr:resolvase [Niastella vici]
MRLAIAYYRVSTKRQGRSHLGLDAQQAAIAAYCAANGYALLHEIQEVKSTRKHRPGLQEALATCMALKATLIVARLDRLGRDVEEVAHNVKLSVDIVVTDNPHANRFTIHILAAVAEEQRRTIGENTRAALQAAKQKGKKLGKHGKKLAKKNKRDADAFAKTVLPVIKAFATEGITSVRAIATELNKRNVPTFRAGAQWHATSVQNLMCRVKINGR